MKLTKKVENLEKSAVKLTVTVAKADVAEGYNSLLKKYAKEAQIPGFRKGHVPANILERKFGESIKMEVMGNLIDSSLNEIFADEKEADIRPLNFSQPQMDEVPEFDLNKDLTYTVTYDVFPKVEVKNFDGITVKEPQVSVSDDDLNEELKAIQERNAMVIDKKDGEKVAKDDIVTINYAELDDKDAEIAGSKREGFVFTVGTAQNIYKIDDDIIGMKKDETKTFTKKYAADDANADLAGKEKKISVTVTAIKVRDLPALDDDLAQDVSDKFKTLDDLKNDIKLNLEKAKDRRVSEMKSNSLLEQLVEKNAFDLPQSMVKAELDGRWRMMAQQFQTTTEQLEKMITASGQTKEAMLTEWTGDCEKMLKSRIIVDALLREKNISVTPEEIDAEYQKIADQNGISVEEVKKHYDDPRAKEYLIDEAKEQKLYEELYKQVKVTKGDKVSFKDLFSQR